MTVIDTTTVGPLASATTTTPAVAVEAQICNGVTEGAQVTVVPVAKTIKSEIMKEIYCGGSLLEAVQKANIFRDCKHFVDMPLKVDAESTLHDWQNLIANGQIDENSLRSFVESHFDEPGGELDAFQPSDFDPEYGKFETINCPSYRQWAKELHRKWPTLCRKEFLQSPSSSLSSCTPLRSSTNT